MDKQERINEREERRQEAEKRQKNKRLVKRSVWGGVFLIIIALIVTAVVSNVRSPGKYDEFAQCLTDKGFVEYGAYWCPNCAEQKQLFGKSFKFVNYVECDPRGANADPALCQLKGITGYPTWITPDGEQLRGTQQLETLSELSGCELSQ